MVQKLRSHYARFTEENHEKLDQNKELKSDGLKRYRPPHQRYDGLLFPPEQSFNKLTL